MESLPPEMVALVLAYAKPKIEMRLDITLFSNSIGISIMDEIDIKCFNYQAMLNLYIDTKVCVSFLIKYN